MPIGLYNYLYYTQRGLRHCLFSGDGQYQSLIRGMSDETLIPALFLCVFLNLKVLTLRRESAGNEKHKTQ